MMRPFRVSIRYLPRTLKALRVEAILTPCLVCNSKKGVQKLAVEWVVSKRSSCLSLSQNRDIFPHLFAFTPTEMIAPEGDHRTFLIDGPPPK
jgi:hypothetical protein